MTDSEWLIVTKIKAPPNMTRAEIIAEIKWRMGSQSLVRISLHQKTATLVERKKGRARK